MVDIQSAGKKEERRRKKLQGKNIMSSSAMQGGHKKLKLGIVTTYDIRPGNGQGLFWFQWFTHLSLTCLDTYPLTYSPGTHTGPTS